MRVPGRGVLLPKHPVEQIGQAIKQHIFPVPFATGSNHLPPRALDDVRAQAVQSSCCAVLSAFERRQHLRAVDGRVERRSRIEAVMGHATGGVSSLQGRRQGGGGGGASLLKRAAAGAGQLRGEVLVSCCKRDRGGAAAVS